jgi:hypothetical protein
MRDTDLVKTQLKRLFRPIYGGLAVAVAGSLLLGASAASAAPTSAATPSAAAHAKQPRGIYAITFAPHSALYRLSPGSHRARLVGRTRVRLTDLAFRGRTLYAISFTDLYRLNARTGARHTIGKLGVSGANALATRPATNTLYGADRNGILFRVNPRTGRATIVGRFGGHLLSAGDLTFADGHLYATVEHRGSTRSLLASVNARTGAATVIGSTGYRNVYGLVTRNGALYGATFSGKFLAICRRTGRARAIWDDGLPIGGLAARSLGTWRAVPTVC